MIKSSTESNTHPYLKAAFPLIPENQFWDKPSFRTEQDKNGYSEEVLEWSDKAKAYYNESVKNHRAKVKNRTHNL